MKKTTKTKLKFTEEQRAQQFQAEIDAKCLKIKPGDYISAGCAAYYKVTEVVHHNDDKDCPQQDMVAYADFVGWGRKGYPKHGTLHNYSFLHKFCKLIENE